MDIFGRSLLEQRLKQQIQEVEDLKHQINSIIKFEEFANNIDKEIKQLRDDHENDLSNYKTISDANQTHFEEEIKKLRDTNENNLSNYKTIIDVNQKTIKKLKDDHANYKQDILSLEPLKEVFEISPTYVSVNNRRVVKARDAIGAADLVTKLQLEGSIQKTDKLEKEIKNLKENYKKDITTIEEKFEKNLKDNNKKDITTIEEKFEKEIKKLRDDQINNKKDITAIEEKLKAFGITPTYVSMKKRRIVQAGDAIDSSDLVTKLQLEDSIQKTDKLEKEIKNLKDNYKKEIKKLRDDQIDDKKDIKENFEKEIQTIITMSINGLESKINEKINKIHPHNDEVTLVNDPSEMGMSAEEINNKMEKLERELTGKNEELERKIRDIEFVQTNMPIDQFGPAV